MGRIIVLQLNIVIVVGELCSKGADYGMSCVEHSLFTQGVQALWFLLASGGNFEEDPPCSGRRAGIYSSWIDCFVQVDRFKGSACDVFNSHGEAISAWEAFCKSLFNVRRDIIRGAVFEGGGKCEDDFNASEYVMCVASERCIAQWNMQLCLRQACHVLRIGDPTYTRQEVKDINGKKYYRFMASLPTQVIGIPPVSLGRYALDENDAREDVVVSLLQRLQATTGLRVIDFNYRNVLWMEEYIRKLENEVEELIMVNVALVEEMRIMQGNK
ncbi:Ribonuclease H1, N-terminal [Sesbania bispinosa]|nr:Ribonuclease H1, N-terminal [Sesbania bispinosa]